MSILKIIIRTVLLLLLAGIIGATWYAWKVFPLISGYGSKNMCSAVYLQHRDPKDILREDLGSFPQSLGTFTVNKNDSSVTGSVWGFAKRKTIYRAGVGCTVINDLGEGEIRSQQFLLPSPFTGNSDTIPWPYGDKLVDTIPPYINRDLLEKATGHVMREEKNGKPTYTRAVLVVYDGKIIAEKYAMGFGKNTVMPGWSVSKSLIGAMIGILVKQGKLNVDSAAPVPEWINTDKQKITVQHLLQQTTGLDFTENYTKPSEVTNMLFNKGDMAAYTANLPLKYEPGTVFSYSSGNTNILSRIIRETVGEREYPSFPYLSLFYKINAYSFLLEPDASGTYIGSSYSYATPRDFARFGLLYYNNGAWGDKQILPVDWVSKSIQAAKADRLKHYGYQFWLNGFNKTNPIERWYHDVPDDMYFADGYGGQEIYIIPSKKLVVVRLGLHPIDENRFLKEVIASIKE